MVLPDRLMQKCENQILHFSSTVSRIDQMILNQFLKDGYYERHLNRMRIIYGKRHDFLLKELKKIKGCRITGENAGVHLLVEFVNGMRKR